MSLLNKYRNHLTMVVVLIFGLFLVGCAMRQQVSTKPSFPDYRTVVTESKTPIIGLIADSQISTLSNINSYSFWRNSSIDKHFVDVSIRPPAIDVLSIEMLRYLLHELTEKVDIVIYLGDGANNGCNDEVTKVIDILKGFQKTVPIFYVIGNHDYLGTGNTPDLNDRYRLCNQDAKTDNKPLSKLDLIKIIHNFNLENDQTAHNLHINMNYIDSYDSIRLKSACLGELEPKGDSVKPQHAYKGCYLAGRISYTKNGMNTDILLTDTSDYHDVWNQTEIGKYGFYGIRGSISWQGDVSQLRWFERNTPQGNVIDTRIIISHYPVTDFNFPGASSIGRPDKLLDLYPKPLDNNHYWFSAHTHRSYPYINTVPISELRHPLAIWYKIIRKKPKYIIASLNIGSTTDFEPHSVIATVSEKNEIQALPLFLIDNDNSAKCQNLIQSIDADHAQNTDYETVLGRKSGHTIFGLNKSYQNDEWDLVDWENSVKNLDILINDRVNSGYIKTDVINCLAWFASKQEGSRVTECRH